MTNTKLSRLKRIPRVPAQITARFAGLYAMRKAGYVLRSVRVFGALGSSVAGVKPACGWSLRGTSADTLLSGDVVRKLLVQMEQQADLSQPVRRPPQEPRVAVNVRAPHAGPSSML
jgi:hypothetical protein